MENISAFIKTCLLGGLLVLLPLLVLYKLLSELMNVVVTLATPIADFFPEQTFDVERYPVPIAIVVLVATSFVFGLALRSRILTRLGSWIERTSLERFPMYAAVKRLTRGLLGAEEEGLFSSGLLSAEDGSQELVYIVERLSQGKLAVIVPMAPTGFSGRVKIVDEASVVDLQASVGEASKVLANWGFGMSGILEPRRDPKPVRE